VPGTFSAAGRASIPIVADPDQQTRGAAWGLRPQQRVNVDIGVRGTLPTGQPAVTRQVGLTATFSHDGGVFLSVTGTRMERAHDLHSLREPAGSRPDGRLRSGDAVLAWAREPGLPASDAAIAARGLDQLPDKECAAYRLATAKIHHVADSFAGWSRDPHPAHAADAAHQAAHPPAVIDSL